MKHTTRLFPTLILIAVFILSACSPAASSPTPEATSTVAQPEASPVPAATLTLVPPEATVTLPPPTDLPPFVPTSRGPDLHATDPTTVNLASGQLQLVEFFRFT